MPAAVKRKKYIFEAESMGADAISETQEDYQVFDRTVHIWWENGSSPVGEIELWGRVNPEQESDAIYMKKTLSAALSVSGNSGSLELNLTAPLAQWQLRYIRTSGDGELYASVEGVSRG